MNTPDAFLFDMDGLLLDSERVYLAQAVALLAPTGRDPKDVSAFFMTMAGTSGAKALHRLTEYLGAHDHAVSFNEDWHAAADWVVPNVGSLSDLEAAAAELWDAIGPA